MEESGIYCPERGGSKMLRFSELRCQEVINICDGCRIGFVSDLEMDRAGGNVCALIVPGRARLFGLLGREHDYVIPWGCIRRFGCDIILVEVDLKKVQQPCKKRRKIL